MVSKTKRAYRVVLPVMGVLNEKGVVNALSVYHPTNR